MLEVPSQQTNNYYRDVFLEECVNYQKLRNQVGLTLTTPVSSNFLVEKRSTSFKYFEYIEKDRKCLCDRLTPNHATSYI